jgi:hypothetical protein
MHDAGAGGRLDEPSRKRHSQLDELLGRDEERPQLRDLGIALDRALHALGMTPHAVPWP